MLNREYKEFRKSFLIEYDDGLLTERKLGEKLLYITNEYRVANNIPKTGNEDPLSLLEIEIENRSNKIRSNKIIIS